MADYVVSSSYTLDDQVTAKANAMAAGLNSAADAADVVDTKLTNANKSATSFTNKLDPIAAAAKNLAAALKTASDAQATLSASVDLGGTQLDSYQRSMQTASDKVDAARAKLAAVQAVASQLGDTFTEASTGTQALYAQMDVLAAASQRAQTAQQALNQTLGVQLPDSAFSASRAADVAAYGKQLDAVRAKYDPLFAVSKQYESQLDGISEAEAQGAISATTASAARDRATQSFQSQIAAANKLAAANEETAATASATTTAHNALSGATAGVTREFIVLGHEALTGNYSRIPGSLMVLAERTDALHTALGYIAPLLTGIGGAFTVLGVAAVAGLGIAAYNTESANLQLIALQNTLQATRADYASLATQAQTVGKSVNIPGVSATDATSAAAILESARNYSATDTQLKALLTDTAELAKVMGTDTATAAHTLANAMNDPAAAAKKAETDGFQGFNAALVDSITLQAASGDKAGAFARFLDALQPSIAGVSTKMTPLEQALHDLGQEFTGTGGSGQSFGQVIGGFVVDQIAGFIKDLTNLIESMKEIYGYAQSAANLASNFVSTGGGAITSTTSANNAAFAAADPAMQGALVSGSQASGVNVQVLAALQQIENAARNPDGSWPTSPAGATGPMQMLPSTFAQVAQQHGITGTDDASQVAAAGFYLTDLAKQFGSLDLAIAAYNAGPGRISAALKTGDSFPDETTGEVQRFRSLYSGNTLTNGQTAPASANTPVPVVITGNSAGAANNSIANDAFTAYQSSGALSVQQAQNSAQQQLLQAGIGQASSAGDTDTVAKLTEALQRAQGAATDLITAQQKLSRSATDAVAPLSAQDGATRDLATVQQQFAEAARASGKVDQVALYQAEAAELQKLTAAHNDAVVAIQRDTAAQSSVAAAYGQGANSVIQATNAAKALADAQKTSLPDTDERIRQIQTETDALNAQSAVKAQIGTLNEGFVTQNQLQQIQLQTALFGQNTDAITAQLDALKQRQDIISRGGDVDDTFSKTQLANVAALDSATAALKRQQDAMSELSSFGEQAFNTIGDAITQAFATGSTAGLSFKSIMDSVISELVQEFLKLAVLDPILNALFGTSKTTLSDVGGILGNIGGGATGSGLLGAIGLGGAAAAAGSASGSSWDDLTQGGGAAVAGSSSGGLFGTGISSGTAITGLGILGAAASLSQGAGLSAMQIAGLAPTAYKAASFLAPQATSTVTNYVFDTGTDAINGVSDALGLTTNAAGAGLSGGTAAAGAAAGQSVGVAAADDVASAAAGTAADAAGAVANALPYIGTAISIITDLAQGNYRGAGFVAGGAATGAAIGSVVPVVGTAVGAAIGAVVGGLVDTFFPQHAKNAYMGVNDAVAGGQLTTGAVVSQLDDPTQLVAGVNDWNANFNAFLKHLNLTITNADGTLANVGAGITGIGQLTSPDQIISHLQIGSTDHSSNFGIAADQDLRSQTFPSVDALTNELQVIAAFADRMTSMGIQLANVGPGQQDISVASVAGDDQLHTALNNDLPNQVFANEAALDAEIQKVDQFVNGTLPTLMSGLVKGTSDFQQSIAAVEAQYESAEAQAQAYGLGISTVAGLQQEAASVMTQELVTEVNKSGGINDTINGIWAAQAAANGNQEQADLINFDVSAKDQTDSFSTMLTDTFGNAFAQTAEYAQDMAILESSLADQRAAVINKYTDAAKQSVTSVLTSIDSYATNLQTSSESPLSPQAQYSLAASQFNTDAVAAAGGDFTSASNLTSFADAFLQASQAVNGSGAQYAADFQSVLTALASVTVNTDALTNSAMLAATQTQTDALTTAIGQVTAELTALRAEVAQQALRPARA